MEVPIIVTLASKSEKAAKLLQLGPGSIIEFDQNCADPLLLSVNNLPVGTGEAVKVGEHFGLKVLQILPAEDRLDQLNTRSAR
jgi:flagellar motor switch protein FliN/FliY